MAKAMVESWKLATISMWAERLDKSEALNLIVNNFTWNDLWESAAEINRLCKARDMTRHIPKNQDQGDLKDRVRVLGNAMIESLQELKSRKDNPVFVVTSEQLFQVPGVVKDNVQTEPAVTARLDNIEKMVETLTKGFNDMKAAKVEHFPSLQVNGAAVQAGLGQAGAHGGVGTRSRTAASDFRVRSVSPSVKRSAYEAQLHGEQGQHGEHHRQGQGHQSQVDQGYSWSQVVGRNQGRRPRPVQHGTAQVKVAGGEAAPYDIVIGNTNPGSTEEIVKKVLLHVSESMTDELKLQEPLEILEIECLTKPRDDGRRIWTKTWRVQVPSRFKEYMQRPESFPAGWTTRRYFPPRPPRPPVPELDPTAAQPPGKRANLGVQAPH